MREDLTLYVGGEDTFCYRWWPLPPGAPESQRQTFGVLDRRDLEKANVKVVMAEQPMVIGDQAFTTGAIARSSFETVQPSARISSGSETEQAATPLTSAPRSRPERLSPTSSGSSTPPASTSKTADWW
jgi:hypothetical protein